MAWEVILVDEVDDWFMDLVHSDPRTAELVAAAVDQLEADGPTLGRPLVDSIEDSKIHNMKELRPGSKGPYRGANLVRVRSATAGGTAGRWRQVWQVAALV